MLSQLSLNKVQMPVEIEIEFKLFLFATTGFFYVLRDVTLVVMFRWWLIPGNNGVSSFPLIVLKIMLLILYYATFRGSV